MITAYHRPENLNEALELLACKDPRCLPLGGGTVLSRFQQPDFAVIDLSRLGLDGIEREGQLLKVGATAALQTIHDFQNIPPEIGNGLRWSIIREASANIRRAATIAGTIVSSDGRSPFLTALMALDARLVWISSEDVNGRASEQSLGDYLPLRDAFEPARLITRVQFPLNARLAVEIVSRTPADLPIVCVAVATWPSGRTRVVLGGHGKAPILAMDGPEAGGAVVAAREAYRFAEDAWASAAYRHEMAGKLVQRIFTGWAAGGGGE